MSTYNDLFLRDNLSSTGEVPGQGTISTSPDLIPYGTSPVNDPVDFFTDNYGSDVGQDLIANAQNYLYMRAKNLSDSATTGSFYLYYSKASLLLYPSQWQNNALSTSSGSNSVPIPSTAAGAIAVGADPFTWQPQMINDDHYCLIGRIVTDAHPNPIPATGSIDDFAKYIAGNPGMGWRNVKVIDSGSPTFTMPVQYNQGSTSGTMSIIMTCTNVPAGAQVAFSCGTPGPNPVINLPQTQVTNASSFIAGVTSVIPANWNSTITYSYWANGTNPPAGWNITLMVVYFVNQENELFEKGLTFEELGLVEEDHREALKSELGIGPVKGIIVGGHSTHGN